MIDTHSHLFEEDFKDPYLGFNNLKFGIKFFLIWINNI